MIQAKDQRLLKDLTEPVRAPDTCESAWQTKRDKKAFRHLWQ